MKWCEWCSAKVEQNLIECRFCGGSSFVHKDPGREQLDPDKARKLREKRDYDSVAPVIHPASEPRASRAEVKPKETSFKAQVVTNDLPISVDSQLINQINRLELAQNRTTHAVRAFVTFLFYQLAAITGAVFLYFLAGVVGNANSDCSDQLRAFGACAPNAFLVFLAAVVWIGGVIYSSSVGWNELEKSKVQ